MGKPQFGKALMMTMTMVMMMLMMMMMTVMIVLQKFSSDVPRSSWLLYLARINCKIKFCSKHGGRWKPILAAFSVLIFQRKIPDSVKKKKAACFFLTLWIFHSSVWFSLFFEEMGKFGKTEKNIRKGIPKWVTEYLCASEFLGSVLVCYS